MKKSIIGGVGSLSRLWLQFAAKEIKIKNHETFLDLLKNRKGSLLTVSNHISTLDDPLIWGALLEKEEICELIDRGQMRWTVGARELTFTNPLTSWFFGNGQVIPIERGEGIHQSAMDEALEILKTDRWLHFFPEGRVIQYKKDIGRLKWGIARLLMESEGKSVTILPMILKGFDWMKPNDEIPRLNHELEIVIGDPLDSAELLKASYHLKDDQIKRRIVITRLIQDILNST